MRSHAKAPSAEPTTRRGPRIRALILVLALTAFAAMVAAPAAQAAPSHPELPALSHEGTFETACGTATDSAGNYYVSSSSFVGTNKVKVFDPSGGPLTEFPPGGEACNLSVDAVGNVYASPSTPGAITRYKPSKFPPEAGTTYSTDTSLNGTGKLISGGGNGVAINPANGQVLVAETPVNEAQTVARTPSSGTIGGTYKLCKDAAFTECTTAIPTGATTAVKTALEGLYGAGNITSAGGFGAAIRTVIFGGSLGGQDVPQMFCDASALTPAGSTCTIATTVPGHTSRIASYESNGTLAGTIGTSVSGASYYGVDAYGANGRIYATDVASDKAYVFNAAGTTVLKEIDGSEAPGGPFSWPEKATIAVDQSNGNALISDIPVHGVVDEFNAAGKYLDQITHTPAFTEGGPADIAVDSSATANKGNVYVSSGASPGSVFAFGPAEPKFPLATAVTPAGTGEVKCFSETNACASEYSEGSSVELKAVAKPSFKFKKWKEATGSAASCKNSTNPTCTVELKASSSVEAEFELAGFTLTVSKPGTGSGKVTSTPSGIDCGSDCTETFPEGTLVSLSQSADPGSTFKGWGGECSGSGACEVTMSAARNVTATFTAAPLVITTAGATGITPKKAEVAGSVNPNGTQITASSCKVEYGTAAPAYGSTAPCVPADPGAGSSAVAVTAQLSGLTPNTTYHFRFVAANEGGTGLGSDQTFKTAELLAPEVETKAATSVLKESATLNASANPKLEEVTDCHFEYGTTIAYLGGTKPCTPAPGSGNSAVSVSAALPSLTPGQTYHFRVVATNAAGTSNGLDKEFTTPATTVPTVTTTNGATSIGQNSAKVAGTVNPNGVAVTACEVEYGTTASYGSTPVPCEQSPGSIGSGSSAVPVSAQISGLNPNTTYHFRFVAKNAEPAQGSGADGEFKTLANTPTVGSLNPTKGPAAGGNSVVITGTNLTGATEVKFDTTAVSCPGANCTLDSATQITAKAPVHVAGTVNVSVTTPGGTSANTPADDYTYLAAPAVTTCLPSAGPLAGGTQVTITGTSLTGATEVKFGSTSSTFTVESATQIKATSPAGSVGATTITVITPGGTSNTCAFTYAAAPTIGSVSPTQGPAAGGNSVVITGTNLTGATEVKFDTASVSCPGANCTLDSATQITAKAPAHAAGTVNVSVTTPGGTSANTVADDYTYVAAPAVTGLSPNQGPLAGGTSVTVTGTNLTGATQVKFGSNSVSCPGASCTLDSATQITAKAPAGAAGTVDVTVTTTGGTSATGALTKYSYVAAPAVLSTAATSITQIAAKVAGSVDPESGNVTKCEVEYGTSASYGSKKACASLPGAGSIPVAVSASLSGLSANTTYHFRFVATNAGGTSNGEDQTFTTLANTCETDASLCVEDSSSGSGSSPAPAPSPAPVPSPAPKPLKCKKGFKKKTVKGKAKCVKVKKKHRKAHKRGGAR